MKANPIFRNMLSALVLVAACLTSLDGAAVVTIDSLIYTTYPDGTASVKVADKSVTSVVILPSVTENGQTYTVTTIGEKAFNKCFYLTSAFIPSTITRIESYAFGDCEKITSIDIPQGVTYIGEYAFYRCARVPSFVIPQGITTIYNGTFSGCIDATSIYIPNSVTVIGDYAFSQCQATSFKIPNSVTSIGEYAFSYGNLNSITLPNSLTEIKPNTFSYNNLKTVSIPNSVTIISSSAFENCHELVAVDIPGSVTYIGENAFSECYSLKSITIPSSVMTIDNTAFNFLPEGVDVFLYKSTPTSLHLGDRAFGFNFLSARGTLHVPVGSLEAYSNATVWSDLFDIVDDLTLPGGQGLPGDVNGDETIDARDVSALINIILSN